mmetsp:Transcript_13022/g.28115  ORF Transcript_13022/g.28115 Transcript_13022/m.28115 type:complete len:296 (+) Transcript_13022:889-1776(+)
MVHALPRGADGLVLLVAIQEVSKTRLVHAVKQRVVNFGVDVLYFRFPPGRRQREIAIRVPRHHRRRLRGWLAHPGEGRREHLENGPGVVRHDAVCLRVPQHRDSDACRRPRVVQLVRLVKPERASAAGTVSVPPRSNACAVEERPPRPALPVGDVHRNYVLQAEETTRRGRGGRPGAEARDEEVIPPRLGRVFLAGDRAEVLRRRAAELLPVSIASASAPGHERVGGEGAVSQGDPAERRPRSRVGVEGPLSATLGRHANDIMIMRDVHFVPNRNRSHFKMLTKLCFSFHRYMTE